MAGMPVSTLLLVSLLAQANPSVAAPPIEAHQAAPTTQPTLEQLRAEHKQLVEQEFSALPRRAAMPISKVLVLSVDEGNLHVRPLLEPTAGSVAIDATDWPGMMHVAVGAPQTLMMHLKHVDLSKPDQIATYTQIITGVDYLQISRDSESDHGLSSITLIQSRQFADENDDPIRLTVRFISDNGDTPDVNLQIAGESFAALRRDHAEVMRKYFLPILIDLHAQSLMRTSDPATAWQVLSTEVQVDPAVRAKVVSLLEKLRSAEFADRASAEEQLAALGAPAAALLSRIDTSDLPADPKATVETIVRSHSPLAPDRVDALRKDLGFLCDTLLLDDPALRAAALSRIGDLTGKAVELPESLSAAEREKRIAALRADLVPTTQPGSQR
jgi:hypothetical protein